MTKVLVTRAILSRDFTKKTRRNVLSSNLNRRGKNVDQWGGRKPQTSFFLSKNITCVTRL